MNTRISETCLGRPYFFDTKKSDEPHPSIFKNRSIQQLRPSDHDPYSCIGKIYALILRILNFFITLSKPSIINFKALVTDGKNKNEMLKLFTDCVSTTEKQHSLLQECNTIIQEAHNLKFYINEERTIQERIRFRTKIKQKIQELKNGQSLLLPSTQSKDVNIFYLLQKHSKGYSLKIIGCDQWMTELSGVPPKKVGGKEKILSQIAFDNIPSKFFTDDCIKTLFSTPLMENFFNPAVVRTTLGNIPPECHIDTSKQLELWVTKSESPRKVLGLVTQSLSSQESHAAKVTRKRLEFQTRLHALFAFFKQSRFLLKEDKSYSTAMRYLLREVAKEATLLGTKKYLTNEELKEIQSEFNFIEQTLQKAEELSFVPLTKLGNIAPLALILPLKDVVKPPVILTKNTKPFEARPPTPITETLPVGSTSIFSREEIATMKSLEIEKILTLLKEKTKLAKGWSKAAYYDLSNAMIFEITKNLNLHELINIPNETQLDSWHFKLSAAQNIEVLDCLQELTETLTANSTYPVSNQSIVVLQLMLFGRFLYNMYKYDTNSMAYHHIQLEQIIADIFNIGTGGQLGHSRLSDWQRPFYQADEENTIGVDFLTKELQYPGHFNKMSPENDLKRHEIYKKQIEAFWNFYPKAKPPARSPVIPYNSSDRSGWSKPIKHPLLISALLQMTLKGNLLDAVYKLYKDGKLENLKNFELSYHNDGEDLKISGKDWKKSEEERKELQQNLDQHQSLYLPEAASDDPQRVFEAQLKDLNEVTVGPRAFKSFTQFKKEELTDLLYLLRKDSPQLEAIGFIKSHPHLLSNPDIRNYLEIVLFDVGGSSIKKMIDSNKQFIQSLPEILSKEVENYRERVESEPEYYDHLLFILSLVRKFRALYQAHGIGKDLIHQFDQILQSQFLYKILDDPSLGKYHFRALLEYLMYQINKPKDLAKIARYFNLLKHLPREPHDVDPNEMDKLKRHVSLLMYLMYDNNVEQLTPLLDTLCDDMGLKLDSSAWKGTFPIFKNDQYEINLLDINITDSSSGTFYHQLPEYIRKKTAYKFIFKDVDKSSLRVRLKILGEKFLYFISDKEKEWGSIEREKGQFKFYRKFSEKTYQAVHLTKEHEPLNRIAGKILYFAPDNPHEGLCLDEKGTICFKIALDTDFKMKSIIDCRSGKDSEPYTLQTVHGCSHASLDPLKQFENEKDILLFLRNGKLEKVEFIRYGFSFVFKNGKLFSETHRGYYIDMQSKEEIPHSLILHHSDPTMPTKIILPDASVLKSKVIVNKIIPIRLEKLWIFIKRIFTKRSPDPESFLEKISVQGPQHTKDLVLQAHTFQKHPYTNELIVANEKMRIEGGLALISHALFTKNPHQALLAMRQLRLTSADLSQENISLLLKFLQTKSDDGHAASIKIQIALKLKRLMGKKIQFDAISGQLTEIIHNNCLPYLRHGRKLYQRLILSKEQLHLVAKILQKYNSFYDEHLRIFFLENLKTPTFNSKDGAPDWSGYDEIDHDEHLYSSQASDLHELAEVPTELLEKQIAESAKEQLAIAIEQTGEVLLFEQKELEQYFNITSLPLPEVNLPEVELEAPSCEKKAVEKLKGEMEKFQNQNQNRKQFSQDAKQKSDLLKTMREQKSIFKTQASSHRKTIDLLLHGNGDPIQSLAITAGLQKIATFEEIALAFMQKDLQSLSEKKLLPSNLDLDQFETALRQFFEAEIKAIHLENAEKLIDNSDQLYQSLSIKRFYSSKKNPELLVYECYAQQVFRQLGFEKNQVHMLSEMMKNPSGVFQAITGGGKTTVLSVIRGLLQANGTNLVTFRILPTLFAQSKSILEQRLGNAFRKKIYSLQFNLKLKLTVRENAIEESLFKKIYHEMLVTIKTKGCMITDYKSIPLMQEKWIKLNREFLARQRDNTPIPEIEKEHWIYLRKILLLIQEREEALMDEFDVPNRSCNRLQIPLGKPIELAPFLSEISLKFFNELRNDPELKLAFDMQRDVSEEVRRKALHSLAEEICEDSPALLDYFLGKREIDLSKFSKKDRDMLALAKDQFSIFLPLTLRKASGLDYQRSADGKRTVPCHEGEPQENSRFGHPLEEINYTIQDYIQNGVSLNELKEWIKTLQEESIISSIPQEQFAEFFPDETFPKEELSDTQLRGMQKKLNQNWTHVQHFLKIRLKELYVSGEVISMTPHDSAAMSKATSGLSATLGCPEELPRELKLDPNEVNGILGEMSYRLIERSKQKPLEFDPEDPFELLSQGNFHALIDGAGAFRSHSARKVAKRFLKSQPSLKQVGYHNGRPAHVGDEESALTEKGFYFTKAKSRGADIALDPQAKALLTVDGLKTFEDLMQNDGRMRLKGQTVQIARSKLNPEITDTESLLVRCARNAGQNDSIGLFRSKMQQIPHLVRQEAYKQLLHFDDISKTVSHFEKWETLFIQKPSHDYSEEGSYYELNKHIRKIKFNPADILNKKKAEWLKIAEEFGLEVEDLRDLTWNEELLEKMPPLVPGANDTVSIGLELEQEVEIEQEVETEMDVEIETELEEEITLDHCGDVPYYPPWIKYSPKEYSVSERFHKTFDSRIFFTENFLPVERNDALFKRTPFDRAMPKIRVIHVFKELEIEKIIIGDVLDDVLHRPYDDQLSNKIPRRYEVGKSESFNSSTSHYGNYLVRSEDKDKDKKKVFATSYDIRTRQRVAGDINEDPKLSEMEDFHKIVAQVRFINGDYEGYSEEEWDALCEWLKGIENVGELLDYFENTILRHKPRKVAAFKKSPLYKLLHS